VIVKGFAGFVLEQGARVVGRAAGVVLSDPRGQEALARAVGLAQRGRQAFEAVQERALHAAGLAARPDYAELRKQVARLKRKARELGEQLDAGGAGAGPPPAGAASGGGRGEGTGGSGSR
jgi:hypothetical protein